ncbi:MAG: ExbD/TolR family protein [Saprospiraceae bacterium]
MSLENKRKIRSKFNPSFLKDNIFQFLLLFLVVTFPFIFFSASIPTSESKLKMLDPPSRFDIITQKIDDVTISRKGILRVNGRTISKGQLDRKLNDIRRKKGRQVSMTISLKKGAPTESIILVMDAMRRLGINGILAMEDD